jgi:hypothetical protein
LFSFNFFQQLIDFPDKVNSQKNIIALRRQLDLPVMLTKTRKQIPKTESSELFCSM